MSTIGDRVKASLARSSMTQSALARAVGMSESALSKAIAGSRAFATIEVVRIAERLGVSLHELVTGEPDPFVLTLAARHAYDDSGEYSSSLVEDRPVLEGIALLYRQAYGV